MSGSLTQSNTLVMNKYLLMGRQLRNVNDVGSIINWANAMNMVKGLRLKLMIFLHLLPTVHQVHVHFPTFTFLQYSIAYFSIFLHFH